jgi:pilus assembly protein CpaB
LNLSNRRGLVFLVIGLVAAVGAGILVYLISNNAAQTAVDVAPKPTPVAGQQVLMAFKDIDANTVVTTSMVATATFPSDLVPGDAYTSTAGLIGQTARIKVFAGQILLQRQFIAANGRIGSSASVVKGKVLVAFPSTDIINSTGAVQPGDHVDILLSIPISGSARLDQAAPSASQQQGGAAALVSQATLQNIEVANVGVWTPPNQGADTTQNQNNQGLKIISFQVDHQEALILKFVKDSGGTIDLVVRSLEDGATVDTDPVNLDYLVDTYRFIGLPQNKK